MPRGVYPRKVKTHRKQSLKRKSQPQLLSGTDPLIQLLIRSICEKYPNDPSMPGIVLSWLPGMKMYYVSITRYAALYGNGAKSICSAKSESLINALNKVVTLWRNKVSPQANQTELFLKWGE